MLLCGRITDGHQGPRTPREAVQMLWRFCGYRTRVVVEGSQLDFLKNGTEVCKSRFLLPASRSPPNPLVGRAVAGSAAAANGSRKTCASKSGFTTKGFCGKGRAAGATGIDSSGSRISRHFMIRSSWSWDTFPTGGGRILEEVCKSQPQNRKQT